MIHLHPLTNVITKSGHLHTVHDLNVSIADSKRIVLDGNGVWTKVTKLVKVPIVDPVQIMLKNGLSLVTERGTSLVVGYPAAKQRLKLKSCEHLPTEELEVKRTSLVPCKSPEFPMKYSYDLPLDPYELGVFISTGRVSNREKLVIDRTDNYASFYLDDSETLIRLTDDKYVYREPNAIARISKMCGTSINKKLPREAITYGDETFLQMLGGILDSIGVITGRHYQKFLIRTKSHTLANSLLIALRIKNFNVYAEEQDGTYTINFLEPEEKMRVLLNYSNLYTYYQEFLDLGREPRKIYLEERLTSYTVSKILTPDIGRIPSFYALETESGSICANNILVDTLPGFEYIKEKKELDFNASSLYPYLP